MDGNTTDKTYECRVFDFGHSFQFDSASDGHKTVFSCACGATQIEYEDAGTGA